MEKYEPENIERKWQKIWEDKEIFKASDRSKKTKFYLLVEFPYPSGAGLHVGHCRSYTALDVVARKKRMSGQNVLFPMGWDAFGLPTENYAIKTGIHPAMATKQNSENFKRQEKMIGLSFDWSREINTSDPEYYKWTQWIFIQLFKNGLAYKERMPINWCPSCKIGLANEEVIGGKCERCGADVEKKEKEQWMLKITEYAERLIKDLDLVDYPDRIKISQKEWIGKSEGAEIIFKIHESDLQVPVFTTRSDTLFSCTYLVLAPEHFLIDKLKDKISNYNQVKKYIEKIKTKSEEERRDSKEKFGIELEGIKATNPGNNQKIPIFLANYVLAQYGTGAIMAVPAYDERDLDFAKKYSLPVVKREVDEKIIEWLERRGLGAKKTNYKLRDWIFSRQRYWGEPIPMVFCEKCGWQPVSEKDLPVKLPEVKNYLPTEEGESPLAKAKNWVEAECPKCKERARRETDVMPNWAGSNWYYLRYCDPNNDKKLADPKKLNYWMASVHQGPESSNGVDWYNGGMEHTTLHLLYSRFIYKFLWDIGAVPKSLGLEPYKKRTSHGMVLGEGGIKMSKSKGNVVNPEEVIKEYGADTLRVYEMFMGPFEQSIPWDTKGLKGARRFLEKAWKLSLKLPIPVKALTGKQNSKINTLIHKTIKKVGEDIENLKFNTAVSSLMILANALDEEKEINPVYYSQLLVLLSPFAPHIAEELWQKIGLKGLCSEQEWPEHDSKLTKEEKINLLVQVNGKLRDRIEVDAGTSEKEARRISEKSSKVLKYLEGKKTKKIVFVPDKLINFVI
jgi:leucyl-tRNA synthetase